MALNPQNPDQAFLAITKTVDKLSGQLAALMAYIAHTTTPAADSEIRAIQGLAQSLSPGRLGPPGETDPQLAASKGVEKIQSMTKSVHTIRSAGRET